jgi:hypothetical protein
MVLFWTADRSDSDFFNILTCSRKLTRQEDIEEGRFFGSPAHCRNKCARWLIRRAFLEDSLPAYLIVQLVGGTRVSLKDKTLEMFRIFGPPLGAGVVIYGGFYLLVALVLQ